MKQAGQLRQDEAGISALKKQVMELTLSVMHKDDKRPVPGIIIKEQAEAE